MADNSSSDGASFSSPVPVIGLYIAGASVACMLMMLWDIGAGIVAKKGWLPCKAKRSRILGKWHKWKTFIGALYKKSISASQLLIAILSLLVHKFFHLPRYHKLYYFNDLPHNNILAASKYIVLKSVDEIIKFREVSTKVSLKNMLHFLPQTSARQYPRVNGYQAYLSDRRIPSSTEICSLSVALLMKIAEICIPKDHLGSLLPCAYLEAKEIVHFIDKTLLNRDLTDTYKLSYAKALWAHGDFSCLIPDNILGIQPDLNRAVAIMKTLKETFHEDDICYEIEFMVDFINLQNYSSVEELSDFIKEMLGYMLRFLITQLPVAIHTSLSECSREEFEERVQLALSFLFKMESTVRLEPQIDWSFPPATGISSFIVDETPAPSTGPLRRLGELNPHSL